METLNIVFIGCVETSYQLLNHLLENANDRVKIVGVVTKESSTFHSDFQSLKPLAARFNIPLFNYNQNKTEMNDWLKHIKPDIIYCFGWSHLLNEDTLSIPEKGVIGFHPTKLPENRGRHPIVWTLALGLNETASTFFYMKENADDGEIISQSIIPLENRENARTLYNKIIHTAKDQMIEMTYHLAKDNVTPVIQNDSHANYWRKRCKEDGRIDWRMSTAAIDRLVRALTSPYIGAHVEYQTQEIKVLEAFPVEVSNKTLVNIEPGKVVAVNGSRIQVKCSDGIIELIEHDFQTLPEAGEYLM
ncbi:formyltransferase family protein [Salibacterium lacus]|uniref:Formyltransferase family protein n=1 Tax=Salibacterium lacus TaxID=1898109 RepID=A0ABW5T0V6_9BACI